jgi:hypothetical protein
MRPTMTSGKSGTSRRPIEGAESRTARNLVDKRDPGHSLASMLEIGGPNANRLFCPRIVYLDFANFNQE